MWNIAVNNISYSIYPLSTRTEKGYITKMIPFFFVQYIYIYSIYICYVILYNYIYIYRLLMRSTRYHVDRVRYWLTDAVGGG